MAADLLDQVKVEPRLGLDHTQLRVRDVHKARDFYVAALGPLGYRVFMEGAEDIGFNVNGSPDFWLGARKGALDTPITAHVAFSATSRAMVDAFYDAAIKAGGTCNGKPGLRTQYHPDYYGAFVLDPDGYNIEAVCHLPENEQVV